ncbi:MAG: hypothetical protein JXA42_16850 [Anaerolineales bacterium]|nr:hypothetical protein [Anaerolineales bacterium]
MKRIGIVVDGSVKPEQISKKLIRRRKRKFSERIPDWIVDYAVELGIGAAILCAIFLLVEPWNLRECLTAFIGQIVEIITMSLSIFGNFIKRLTLSDTIAIFILLGVIFVIIMRIRWRILRNDRFWSDHCPRCDSSGLKRVRRHWLDKLIGISGIPVRRYRCSECRWRGLRVYVHPGRRRINAEFPQVDPHSDNTLFP